MRDDTEELRRQMVKDINSRPQTREELETVTEGPVWNTEELGRDFTVIGFMAPFVNVIRKSDNAKGTLMFQHNPRFYFSFEKV